MRRHWLEPGHAPELWEAFKKAWTFEYYGSVLVRQKDWDMAERIGTLRQAAHDYDGQSYTGDRGPEQNLRGNVVGALGEWVLQSLVKDLPGVEFEALLARLPCKAPDVTRDGFRVDAKACAVGAGYCYIPARGHANPAKRPDCYAVLRLVRDYAADVYTVHADQLENNPRWTRFRWESKAPCYAHRLPTANTDDLPALEELGELAP
jgi:hypothetical protein